MSIEKKSLISNRAASKKADLTKVSSTQISSTKLKSTAATSKLSVAMTRPKLTGRLAVSMATPKAIVAQLGRDANRVLGEREVRERMETLGAEPAGNTPEEFARFIRDDQAKWSKLMREAGIKPE